MPNYIRNQVKGGCYFFTINCLERKNNRLLTDNISLLKDCVQSVKTKHPFQINAWVVLPEHMHMIMTLPENDADYAMRIRLIKTLFCKNLPKNEMRSLVREKRHERGIWQRRYWEHTIKDDEDYQKHMDYVHYNPVKHGYVSQVIDWPHSTFHYWVERDIYPKDWVGMDCDIAGAE